MDDFTVQGIEGNDIVLRHRDGHVFRFRAGQDGGWGNLMLVATEPMAGAPTDARTLGPAALDAAGKWVHDNHPDRR